MRKRINHRASRLGRRHIHLEAMEPRQLLSGDVRSFDGEGNNLAHPEWGSVGEAFIRTAAAAYGDGISSPAGASRPSARLISNVLAAQEEDQDILNDRFLSAFVYAWGQFLDHDLDLATAASPTDTFNVQVPRGDPHFDPSGTGTQVIGLNRSASDPATGTPRRNPRQQINNITAWIDGSMIYGSDKQRADALRTFAAGRLKTSTGDLLPFNTNGLANANDAHIFPDSQLFLAGDVRANENIELSSLQALFLREHNRLAENIHAANPRWSDEHIYQQARAIVGAEIQAITYNEFLPALLGSRALRDYQGYDSSINPGIANEFAAASFRLHSMIGNDVEFFDPDGEEVRDELSLAGAFFNPPVVQETGIDPILKYLASDPMQEVDIKVVDPLRNFLFGPPGAGGFDLVSLNIQRGRDHGLADYNTTRQAYGLPRVNSFAQITSDPVVQDQLKQLYGSVDNIDLWVGGLAEDHVTGASVGPLIQRIMADQFHRLRDGDRFWYERQFSGRALDALKNTTLASVIRNNSNNDNLQDNVFVFKVTISGMVFDDANRNGRRDRGENGVKGKLIQLSDEDGVVVGTATTGTDGRYSFSGLALGTYQVTQMAQNTSKVLNVLTKPRTVEITRGMEVKGVDFAITSSRNASSGPTRPSNHSSRSPRTSIWRQLMDSARAGTF